MSTPALTLRLSLVSISATEYLLAVGNRQRPCSSCRRLSRTVTTRRASFRVLSYRCGLKIKKMVEDPDYGRGTDNPRSIAVDPPVHVESYPTHTNLSWTAGGIDQFVAALRASEAVPADTTPVVDATTAAGQRRLRLDGIDTTSGATKYVRVEPPAPWTLSWERRTKPVVSLTGSPSPATCQTFHVATTACVEWTPPQRETLSRLLEATA